MFSEDDLIRSLKGRATLVGNIVLFCFFVIFSRLWYLQILKGAEFFNYSMKNWLKKEDITAPRGMIFDRNTKLLVHNIPRIDAVIIPQYLKNKKETIQNLSSVLDMTFDEISDILKKRYNQAQYRPIIIKKNISHKEIAIIETENTKLPGVFVETFVSREYTDKEVGANLLGYISEITKDQLPKYIRRDKFDYKQGDYIGQIGIESSFDSFLRGKDGHEYREVDAKGIVRRRVKLNNILEGISDSPAIPGHNIRLTIDRDLQLVAHEALKEKVGSAVAIDVHTGEVLAMISVPSFDPTSSKRVNASYWMSIVTNPLNPLRDRTIQEHYAPGSTFKTITAIAALEEGVVSPNQKVNCEPTFRLGRRVYHDWKKTGHGVSDLYKSLRRSVDVYYYKIAAQMDIDTISHYAKLFGLGAKTGISLSREIPGLIPSKEWKKKRFGEEWQTGETLSCSIGQSYVLVTPLQLALAYAAIANNGTLYRPYLIKEIFSINGEILKKNSPQVVREILLKPENFKAIQKGLYEVVNHPRGTAWWHRGKGIRMSGKTGTSQVRSMSSKELFSKCSEMPYESRHHGIFVGYAPFDDPQIAVAAVVEHGCSGSGAASPIVEKIITKYMEKYLPEKYKRYYEEDVKAEKAYWAKIKALEKQKEEEEEISITVDE